MEHKKKYPKKMDKMDKMHEKKMKSNAFVEGHDKHIGMRDFANLPQHTVMKEFPKPRQGMGGMIDDTITGIDDIAEGSEIMSLRHLSNQK